MLRTRAHCRGDRDDRDGHRDEWDERSELGTTGHEREGESSMRQLVPEGATAVGVQRPTVRCIFLSGKMQHRRQLRSHG